MKSINKKLEYHELLMTYEDTAKYNNFSLPEGFHYEFFKDGDEIEWAEIHISSGEFIDNLKRYHYQEYLCGDYKVGRYAWILKDIISLEQPIKATGKLNIWSYNVDIL